MTAGERNNPATLLRASDEFRDIVDFFKTARLNKVLLDPQAFLNAPRGHVLHVVADTFTGLTFRHKPGEASTALLGIEWSEESVYA